MKKMRLSLLIIASAIVLTGVLIGDSLFLFLAGIAGLIGIATWGYSSKEIVQIVKSKLNFQS